MSINVTLFSNMKGVHSGEDGVKAIDLEAYGKAHPVLAFFKAIQSNFDGTQVSLGGKVYIVDIDSLRAFCANKHIAVNGDIKTMVSELKKSYLDQVINPIKEGKAVEVTDRQFDDAMEALGITNTRELKVGFKNGDNVRVTAQFKKALNEQLELQDDWKKPEHVKINVGRADPLYRGIAKGLIEKK